MFSRDGHAETLWQCMFRACWLVAATLDHTVEPISAPRQLYEGTRTRMPVWCSVLLLLFFGCDANTNCRDVPARSKLYSSEYSWFFLNDDCVIDEESGNFLILFSVCGLSKRLRPFSTYIVRLNCMRFIYLRNETWKKARNPFAWRWNRITTTCAARPIRLTITATDPSHCS